MGRGRGEGPLPISGQIIVRWLDGSPAARASIMCFFTEAAGEWPGSSADPESAFGQTDESGVLPFGPLAGIAYEQVLLYATHAEAPFVTREWREQRLQEGQRFEVVMTPGRTVSGRLMTPDREPAAGYRVSRLEPTVRSPAPTAAGPDGRGWRPRRSAAGPAWRSPALRDAPQRR